MLARPPRTTAVAACASRLQHRATTARSPHSTSSSPHPPPPPPLPAPLPEEREEYEQHVKAGTVVYAGVDYEAILQAAEAEADVVIWDGGWVRRDNAIREGCPD